MDVKNVRKWCREFTAGRTEIHDEERSGRPSISDETVAKVEQIMRQDRRITLDDICILVPEVSRSTIGRTLTEKLEYRKVCARWVPHMLTEDHQRQRIDSSCEFLQRYADENDNIWIRLSQVTKPGRSTSHLRPNNNHVSGGIPLRPSCEISKQHSLPAKSWQLCFGIKRGYCWSTSWLMGPQ